MHATCRGSFSLSRTSLSLSLCLSVRPSVRLSLSLILSFRGTSSSDTRDWRKASRRLHNSRRCESLDRSMNAVPGCTSSATPLLCSSHRKKNRAKRFTCSGRGFHRTFAIVVGRGAPERKKKWRERNSFSCDEAPFIRGAPRCGYL